MSYQDQYFAYDPRWSAVDDYSFSTYIPPPAFRLHPSSATPSRTLKRKAYPISPSLPAKANASNSKPASSVPKISSKLAA